MAFGKGAFAVPREIRAFELTVSAPPAVEPRRIEAIPGLFCAFGASDVLFKGESRSGAVVSLVNGSKRPIALPPSISLVVRLYRLGSAIPCEDEPVLLGPPPVLAPGAIYRVPFHVSCLGLSVPGTYEVEARLLIGAGPAATTAVEIGRLRVDVSADHRLAPWAPLR